MLKVRDFAISHNTYFFDLVLTKTITLNYS